MAYRISLLFISIGISCSLQLLACGPYYPMGEQVRLSFLPADKFDANHFERFNYSASRFSEFNESGCDSDCALVNANIQAWMGLTEFCVTEDDLYTGIYEYTTIQLKQDSTNSLYQYLEEYSRQDIWDYLVFLEKITGMPSTDPWLYYGEESNPALDSILQLGIERAKWSKDLALQSRYVYVTLRCAMHDHRYQWCEQVYLDFFKNQKPNSSVLWWAYGVYLDAQKVSSEKIIGLAELFVHCNERQFWAWQQLPEKVDWNAAWSAATTVESKRCVCIMAAIDQPYRSDIYIKRLAKLNPQDPHLDFLVLREINKLEDWIFSGRYQNMRESTYYNYWNGQEVGDQLDRSAAKEENYANQLAIELQELGYCKNQYSPLGYLYTGYLQFLGGNFEEASAKLNLVMANMDDHDQQEVLSRIQMLCAAELDRLNFENLHPSFAQVLKNAPTKNQNKWLFTLGLVLHRHQHPVEALLAMTIMDKEEDWESNSTAYWRAPKGEELDYFDYYTDVFSYLSVGFSKHDLLLAHAECNIERSKYPDWLRASLLKAQGQIQHAIGSIGIRSNDLELAEQFFILASQNDWVLHEEELVLEGNPFYTNFYQEQACHSSDTMSWTKASFIKQLRVHLYCMDQPTEPYRAYHAFQAAVGYFNMTRFGNSWELRRKYWRRYAIDAHLSDDAEYNQCLQAQALFHKAAELAELQEFKALCLMMAARCAHYESGDFLNPFYNKSLESSDRFHPDFARVHDKYAEHYKQFMATCYSFDEYFQCYALNGAP